VVGIPIRVCINGYGTIGKRIADALVKTGDFKVVGVSKYSFDYSALIARKKGFRVFVPRDRIDEFRKHGFEPEGTIEDMIDEAELIYDASPGKQGVKNKEFYVKHGKPAIFQGGEPPEVGEVSYSTLCNYSVALGKKYVRVVSCNTTGILRILCSLGVKPRSVFVTIVRRASDPREDTRGPVASILLDSHRIPSHHASDVKTVIGDIPITTASVVVPTTLMHVQVLRIELSGEKSMDDLLSSMEKSGRILFLNPESMGLDTTGKLVELARDAGRHRYDLYENIVFSSTLKLDRDVLMLIQAIHQESIVIPENIDAAYAVLNLETDPFRVVEKTNKALGIGLVKDLITGVK